ncbi:tetratricopeptide repeat protein [Alteromonas sp. 14N.309.X.WAT.G.H12]|uniref:tetratricopeptide repeat protein n=1 Tax=Alteromonas sp. 14N.309.X.WAT.G.H12 TaxID=3120824 RepID=UPI002FD3AA6C
MKRLLILSALLVFHLVNAQAAQVTDSSTPESTMPTVTFDGKTPALLQLQQRWAQINYGVEDKETAFKTLLKQAKSAVLKDPNNPELLIWQGIIQSSTAGAIGGLSALKYAKAARKSFEQAIRIDENALAGSALTSLGVLYHKLPGWPISFGDDKKAAQLLTRALEVNPHGIDPNYFYAEFLFDKKDYADAAKFLHKAKIAPPRENRPLADEGRQSEIATLEQKIKEKT